MKQRNNFSWNSMYIVVEELGKGGNAKVWKVKHKKTSEEYALKQLTATRFKDARSRFRREIRIVAEKSKSIQGILPIIDCSEKDYWFTMPIAKPIMEYIQETDAQIKDIVVGVVHLADTLVKLHTYNITHRDIKPKNLYFCNNQYTIGDFGLAGQPDNKEDLTVANRGLGAIFTMAPEMRRNPKHADGKKADVYSLAKTLWMLLTKNELGFDGTYQLLDRNISLRYFPQFRKTHLVELEELLIQSTQNAPEDRPTMQEFKETLIQWLAIIENDSAQEASGWGFLQKLLFGHVVPEVACWSDLDSIIEILNIIGSIPTSNHMMLPGGGGYDFVCAEKATESGCILIHDDVSFTAPSVVKPARLYCVTYPNDQKWNFFYLQLDRLTPIEAINQAKYEYLVEDIPGHYVTGECAQYGVYNYDTGQPYPQGYRVVNRYCEGSFLFVMKLGPYNGIHSAYDGRHSEMEFIQFHSYVNKLRHEYNRLLKSGISEELILHLPSFGKSPLAPKTSFEFLEDDNTEITDQYVDSHYSEWDFSDLLIRKTVEGNASYYITFCPRDTIDFSILDSKSIILCANGHLEATEADRIIEKAYLLYCREECFALLQNCAERLVQVCQEVGVTLSDANDWFSIRIQKVANPSQIFTREDVELAMRNADDRKNNTLVVDENGGIQILTAPIHLASYPVRLETWHAGNLYVGKYSSLSTLDDTYLLALQGWYKYLSFGRTVYCDYVEGNYQANDYIKLINGLCEPLH